MVIKKRPSYHFVWDVEKKHILQSLIKCATQDVRYSHNEYSPIITSLFVDLLDALIDLQAHLTETNVPFEKTGEFFHIYYDGQGMAGLVLWEPSWAENYLFKNRHHRSKLLMELERR